ncbi:MAG: hypothetical protein MI861_05720, partial [Pirellulales bacterium]|nr:hypothetical protein [Pirellulales bacterium]
RQERQRQQQPALSSFTLGHESAPSRWGPLVLPAAGQQPPDAQDVGPAKGAANSLAAFRSAVLGLDRLSWPNATVMSDAFMHRAPMGPPRESVETSDRKTLAVCDVEAMAEAFRAIK